MVYVHPAEKCCSAPTRLTELLLVIKVGFPVHVSLEPVNEGLVAVAGFLEDSDALQERQGVAYCVGVAVEPQ